MSDKPYSGDPDDHFGVAHVKHGLRGALHGSAAQPEETP